MKVTVVNPGVGNLPNVVRAFARLGANCQVSEAPEEVRLAQVLVLPGVGAAGEAMARLSALGLHEAVREAVGRGAWLLGICLGHQLLFERSLEFGLHPALGLVPGEVVPLPANLRRPLVGWCQLQGDPGEPLLAGVLGRWFYFVHSFVASPTSHVVRGWVEEGGERLCAVVRQGRVCGVQFHPEKSGAAGQRFLQNFLELCQ